MKNQQVVPDYAVMLNSSIACLILAFGGWVLIRLIQAIILLPRYLERQQQQLAAIHAEPTQTSTELITTDKLIIEDNKSDTTNQSIPPTTTDLPTESQNIIVKKVN